jgi:hypothetical protein
MIKSHEVGTEDPGQGFRVKGREFSSQVGLTQPDSIAPHSPPSTPYLDPPSR